MRIAILGAGAMGSMFGALLAEAGQDVTLVDINKAHIAAINANGLSISTDQGSRAVKNLKAIEPSDASEAADLVIIFTKAMHTKSALEAGRRLIGAATQVLTLQNGLGNVEKISEFVPVARIHVGVTTWPARLTGPGSVISLGAGHIKCFSADGREDGGVLSICTVLSEAKLNAVAEPDIWVAIWEKVAFNAALSSLCATTGCSVDQLGLLPAGTQMLERIISEVCSTAILASVAVDKARVLATVRKAMSEHVGHKPSMLQDVLSRRQTEIDSINGAVARVSLQHGMAVPYTEMLATLVRLMDERNKLEA